MPLVFVVALNPRILRSIACQISHVRLEVPPVLSDANHPFFAQPNRACGRGTNVAPSFPRWEGSNVASDEKDEARIDGTSFDVHLFEVQKGMEAKDSRKVPFDVRRHRARIPSFCSDGHGIAGCARRSFEALLSFEKREGFVLKTLRRVRVRRDPSMKHVVLSSLASGTIRGRK